MTAARGFRAGGARQAAERPSCGAATLGSSSQNRRGDVSSILAQFSQPQFWVAVVQIIWIDIVLSGDNAVVIAMACRGLPVRQRRRGMIIGAGVAAVLLIVFTITVSALISLPYLRLASACALIWIAIKLVGSDEHDAADTPPAESLWRAVRIVVVVDIVMGLDNAVAVAALANGRYVLLGLGLAISIPIVFAGSAIVLALLERFPIFVWAGGALLGWVAGALFVSDPVIGSRLSASARVNVEMNSAFWGATRQFTYQLSLDMADLAFGVLGAIIVILAGVAWRRARAVPPETSVGADQPPWANDVT
jgi:YjbE family integral membrane protein